MSQGRNVIDEIKTRLDIVDVVGAQVELRRAGRNYVGLCPFHEEKSPSFSVNPERGTYKCFGCGKGGDIIEFVKETEKLDFTDALKRLAAQAGIQYEAAKPRPLEEENAHRRLLELNRLAARYYNHLLLTADSAADARRYLDGREIARETWETWTLGYAPASWEATLRFLGGCGYSGAEIIAAGLAIEREGGGEYDRFRDRVVFPIRDRDGETVAFGGRTMGDAKPKYLNSPESPVFTKGAHLYGLDLAQEEIRSSETVVVVEGYVDAVVAHAAGFRNVVATLGTALTPAHVRVLSRLATTVVLALDADAAGDTAALRGWEVLRDSVRHRTIRFKSRGRVVGTRRDSELAVRIARLPRGEDPDTLIRKDPEAWRALVADARPVVDHFFESVREAADLTTPEGRTLAVAELAPVVADLGNPIEKAHYIGRLAEIAGVSEPEIAAEVARGRQAPRPGARRPLEVARIREVSPEQLVLALLWRYPPLLEQAPDDLGEELADSRHRELLERMRAAGPDAVAGEEFAERLDEALRPTALAVRERAEREPELLSNEQPAELGQRVRVLAMQRLREQLGEHASLLREASEMGDEAGMRALLESVPTIAAAMRRFDPPPSPYFKDARETDPNQQRVVGR